MKKKIVVVVGTLVVLAGIAVAVYAAYDVSGSSSPENFTAGAATDLAVDPQSEDIAGILPNETKVMDVLITNNNTVGVTVTGLSLAFNDGGQCVLSSANPAWYPFGLGGGASQWVTVNVSMGDPASWCEGATLQVTATATGTMP